MIDLKNGQHIVDRLESVFTPSYFNRDLTVQEERIRELMPETKFYFIKNNYSDVIKFLDYINDIIPLKYEYLLQLNSIRHMQVIFNDLRYFNNVYALQIHVDYICMYLGNYISKIIIPFADKPIFINIESKNFTLDEINDDYKMNQFYLTTLTNYLSDYDIDGLSFSDIYKLHNCSYEDYFHIFNKNDFVNYVRDENCEIKHGESKYTSLFKLKSILNDVIGIQKSRELLQLISAIEFYYTISGVNDFSYIFSRKEKSKSFINNDSIYDISFSEYRSEYIFINLSKYGVSYNANINEGLKHIEGISEIYDHFQNKIFDKIVSTLNLEHVTMRDVTNDQALLCYMINY